MATSSKKVAASLDGRFGGTGQYYRFNVDQGLQDITLSDWEKASKISAHARNYLSDNQRAVKDFVDNFIGVVRVGGNGESSQAVVPAAELSAAQNNGIARPWYHLPFPRNTRFVGRDQILGTLRDRLFVRKSPRVALVGLGGVGKTQVALALALWTKANITDCSVFWVPALSSATFEQAYTHIARQLDIRRGDDQDVKEVVRQYLSSEAAGRWLLVIDNADDIKLVCGSPNMPESLDSYLPQSENGRIMFTTRSRDVAIRVAEDTIKLDEFSLSEAKELLGKLVTRKDLIHDDASVTELLRELTYLPLAITQAAAYLERNEVSIAEYLGLLRNTEKDMVDLLSEELPDRTRYQQSKNAVATTWVVSFQKIRELDGKTADLLSFMSQIEPKLIPQSLLPELGSRAQTVSAIGTLCGYAFVSKRDDMLDMHSLVHLATRIWLSREGLETQTIETVMRCLAGKFPTDEYENRHTWRAYLPHALRILQRADADDMEEKYELYFWVGRCLQVEGRIREGVRCFEECWRWRSGQFAEEHPSRLASQHALAGAYKADGQIKKAVGLLEQVVAVRERTLTEEHPDRLPSQHALAGAYQSDGQIKKAVGLLEQVVAVRDRTLAEEHPDRLASQHALARAYQSDGQIKKAVGLLEQVVAVRDRTLAEEHPDRLASQHALARAYQSDGQIKKAVGLLEQVVAVGERTLTEEHPDRLASQYNLAMAYRADGQISQALELIKQVVAVESRTLQERPP
ncbi:P-loop containing nucleoside triphosphate hydrolase protein [Apodospora peruviana]|uniref:P-loop containing nucleoside triphosphate hydrolase protein n=1 Tax=Apodospora peruviana TaxID=516989 RepID=A0AAE0ILP4_9PEZI|nr:P-loop containing nucleoside triphosphate hydrolase protein [Apodospora peruviana]